MLKRLGELSSALVWPLERAVAACGRTLFAATEWSERFDFSLFHRLQWLAWPFRALFRGARSLLSLIVPAAVRRKAGELLARQFKRAANGIVRVGDALDLDIAIHWLVWLLRPVWYPVAAAGNFIIIWAATRPYKKMLWGVPALLLVLPILLGASWAVLLGQSAIATRYRLATREALEQKDYQAAQLYERKLAQLGVDTTLSDFNMAAAIARDGKAREAYERMKRLAPLDKPGYPAAHFWMIQRLLAGELQVSEEEAHRLVGAHLSHLESLGMRGTQLSLTKAHWLARGNEPEKAAEILKPLVHTEPAAAIASFRLNLMLKREKEAREDALAIGRHLDRKTRQEGRLAPDEYQWWAAAEQFLGDNQRAEYVLHDWLKSDSTSVEARRSLAALSLTELETMLRDSNLQAAQLAEHIGGAFAAPDPPEGAKQFVIALYRGRQSKKELQVAFDQLAEASDLPAALAETLGTAAALGGEWNRAQRWLEQAVASDPANATAWNNLACVLLERGQETSPDAALIASNKALALSPENHRFRETRGQILLRLGRWQDAVDDLEYALNGMPAMAAIHESLSKAYGELGNRQLAAIHLQYAQ